MEYLKLLAQAEQEAVITSIRAVPTATLFVTQLTSENTRKSIAVYNNSHNLSGECYYGYSSQMTPQTGSVPLLKSSMIEIPVLSAIPVYFCSASGEIGDLRVEELL